MTIGWSKRKRICVEDFQALDIRDIRAEALRVGTDLLSEEDPDYNWRVERSPYEYDDDDDGRTLTVVYYGRIILIRTLQGHSRFRCRCGRLVLVLYGLGSWASSWYCRQCRGAKYSSQRGKGMEHWRTFCEGIMRRFGRLEGYIRDRPPAKMPHMKESSYREYCRQLKFGQTRFDESWVGSLPKELIQRAQDPEGHRQRLIAEQEKITK